MNAEVSTDKLLGDLRTVVADAEALLKATAGQAGERIQEARGRAESSVRQARERIMSLEQDLAAQARAAAREADRYVHDNPWQVIGVAAGAAFLIGFLAGRK